MVTFRKSLLLLAIISMMAVAANAQDPFQCVANAGVPPIVRAEGLAELVGDVLLTCTGGTPTPNGASVPQINFRIFMNTNVTSRLLDGSTNEALLIIDEPDEADLNLCGNPNGCALTGVGAEPGVDYEGGTVPNVYQGIAITGNTASSGGNTIDWLGVPVDPPGTQRSRVIRITNVRANAAQQGVGGLLIPSQLIMFISATGTTALPINNQQVTVGFVQQGLVFDADFDSFLQCEEPGEDTIGIEFSELFPTAFKRRNAATSPSSPTAITSQAQLDPKVEFNTETGFYAPGLGGDAVEAGLASQGTRLLAQFKGIPEGVDLYVSAVNDVADSDVCADATNVLCYEDIATIVEDADLLGAGGDPDSLSAALARDDYGDASSELGWYMVPLVAGVGTATWEIVQDENTSLGDLTFQVMVDYEPNSSAGVPGLGTGAVAGSYGPLSTLSEASSTDLQPRFTDRSEDVDFMEINSCSTNLLWPYVTAQAGFDTGLSIANTSMDPFGTPGQEGTCTINYYGNVNGEEPPPAETTPVVPAGGHAVWTLSAGGAVYPFGGPAEGVINGVPGFQGYVIAQCLFQYAHGYAFLTKLGAVDLAQGYIALILDDPISGPSRTGTKSEPLNQ